LFLILSIEINLITKKQLSLQIKTDLLMNRDNYHSRIPEPALRRLPWYLSYVKLLKKQGYSKVSSTQIAKKINVSATQIAKDLSYVNVSGKTRVGYDIDRLIEVLDDFLGFKRMHTAVLFGVGSLGAALLSDSACIMAAIWLSLMALVPLSVSMSRNTSFVFSLNVLNPPSCNASNRRSIGTKCSFCTTRTLCNSNGISSPL
jgi:hypothetical protein